jgi:hypothetical protein
MFVCLSIAVGGAEPARLEDWAVRHPAPKSMNALVELPSREALAICRLALVGKTHAAVRAFLGDSDLNHGDDEYTYHPERRDGSMWILIVEFQGDNVDEIFAEELSPPDTPPHQSAPAQHPRPNSLLMIHRPSFPHLMTAHDTSSPIQLSAAHR